MLKAIDLNYFIFPLVVNFVSLFCCCCFVLFCFALNIMEFLSSGCCSGVLDQIILAYQLLQQHLVEIV